MLWNHIKKKMLEYPAQTIAEDDQEIRYDEWVNRVERFADTLSGVHCCAVLCQSEFKAAEALLACLAAGVTAVPLSNRYGEQHSRKIMDTVSPDAWIEDNTGQLTVRCLSDSRYCEPAVHPAVIMCTSGTSGNPKGVMLTEANLLTNVQDIADYFILGEEDRILITRPLYHCAVLTGELLTGLMQGVHIRFYSGAFNPLRIPGWIRRNGITVFCGTPTLLSLICRCVRDGSNMPLKHIGISGECMSREVGLRIANTFPKADIYHGYGLTEASPRVSYLPPALFRTYPDCVGVPLPSVEIQVIKEDGSPAQNGEEGVLYVRGGNIMSGYYNEPDRTEEVLSQGWLCTGDIARIHAEGLLKILGRRDDLIIKGGMNIYPQEIEGRLRMDQRVREVLAYGYDGDFTTQIGLQIAGSFSSETEVRELCRTMLPAYQMPVRIELLPELEKNGSGKIRRGGNRYGFRIQ